MIERNGNFIVFEGIDGSGKGTQVDLLHKKLESYSGVRVHVTKEPTTNAIGSMIRSVYLSGKEKIDEKALRCLFTADNLDHSLNENYGTIHKLREGIHVIQDRGYMSNLAYGALTMSLAESLSLTKACITALRPTLTIFIDIDAETSIQRISYRGEAPEIYESVEKMAKIRENYFTIMSLLEEEGEAFSIIDGKQSIERIHELVWQRTSHLFS